VALQARIWGENSKSPMESPQGEEGRKEKEEGKREEREKEGLPYCAHESHRLIWCD
jgi:hypothetical protein